MQLSGKYLRRNADLRQPVMGVAIDEIHEKHVYQFYQKIIEIVFINRISIDLYRVSFNKLLIFIKKILIDGCKYVYLLNIVIR